MRTLPLGVCMSLLSMAVQCSAEQPPRSLSSPLLVGVIKYDGHRSVRTSLGLGKPASTFAAFDSYVSLRADAQKLSGNAVQFDLDEAGRFITFMRGEPEGAMDTSFQRLPDVIPWLTACENDALLTVDLGTVFDSQVNLASSGVTRLVANDENASLDPLAMKLLPK